MDLTPPTATAAHLRALGENSVVTPEEAAALERHLRLGLPWKTWSERLLLALGMALFATGVIFFFAYNWSALAVWQKFTVIEAGVLICAGWAAWKGLGNFAGQIGVMAACVLVGVFLAVFGQIYQTGADAFELFLGWAALITPWVVLTRFGALWMLWLLLLNLGLGLYWDQTAFFSRIGAHKLWDLLAFLAVLNALALAAREFGAARGCEWLQEGWLRAAPLLAVFGTLTTAICGMIVLGWLGGGAAWLPVGVWAAALLAGYYVYRFRWPSLFGLSVIALSLCAVLITWIGHALLEGRHDPFGMFLLMCLIAMLIFGAAVQWLRSVARAIGEGTP